MPDDKKPRVVMIKGARERSVSEAAVEFRKATGWKVKPAGKSTEGKDA